MSRCPLCVERGQTWSGDAPLCAFSGAGSVAGKNWNCATINRLRAIAESEAPGTHREYTYECSQSWATIDLCAVNDERDDDFIPGFQLWMTWYKSRGETDSLWLLGDGEPPVRPTFLQCLAIINYYEKAAQ